MSDECWMSWDGAGGTSPSGICDGCLRLSTSSNLSRNFSRSFGDNSYFLCDILPEMLLASGRSVVYETRHPSTILVMFLEYGFKEPVWVYGIATNEQTRDWQPAFGQIVCRKAYVVPLTFWTLDDESKLARPSCSRKIAARRTRRHWSENLNGKIIPCQWMPFTQIDGLVLGWKMICIFCGMDGNNEAWSECVPMAFVSTMRDLTIYCHRIHFPLAWWWVINFNAKITNITKTGTFTVIYHLLYSMSKFDNKYNRRDTSALYSWLHNFLRNLITFHVLSAVSLHWPACALGYYKYLYLLRNVT